MNHEHVMQAPNKAPKGGGNKARVPFRTCTRA